MSKKKGGKRMSRKQLETMLQEYFNSRTGQTLGLRQIYRDLVLDTHPLRMQAVAILDEMAWDDYITKVDETSYCLNTRTQVQEGRFRRKTNGKNSFIPDDGSQPIFVAERNSMSALEGDRVQVTFLARRQKHIKEAVVTAILNRAKDTFVGKIRSERYSSVLITDETMPFDVLIPKNKLGGAKSGQKAVVKVTEWPDSTRKYAIGEVKDVLGDQGDNDAEMNAILVQYGLPYKYPQAAEDAANKIADAIPDEERARREDFRNVFTCTIDPHDAKDFDDALSIRPIDKSKGLWEVGVHIADVSYYVKPGSIIDREAYNRATSIYLVDRTIPMLPERLCNFICSLRPDEEKLTYSVIFNITESGEVKAWRLRHTIIKSARRYAYEEVQEVIENAQQNKPNTDPNTPMLLTLDKIAKALREARFRNGSVKFDREELHFDVDEKGKPIRCYFKVSKDANKLIEEFMLLANRTVAESIGKPAATKGKKQQAAKVLPYRIHDQPDPQKLETLRNFVIKFGYKMKTAGTPGAISRSLNTLLSDCCGRKEQKLIETVALRAMMKAKYSVNNIGHYGLAFDYYTHFTSPIRRYPDLMVHRLLSRYAEGGRTVDKAKYEEYCEHCSDMEQTAANADRDSIKYKMVEFMEDKIGNAYDAHISSIQSYGIYCEIDENHCEGMVPMRDLDDDYYDFDEKNYCLVGRRHHRKYQLGDPIRIVVARANTERKQLDFTLE